MLRPGPDRVEAALRERRLQGERWRQGRIFDARTRIIGVRSCELAGRCPGLREPLLCGCGPGWVKPVRVS